MAVGFKKGVRKRLKSSKKLSLAVVERVLERIHAAVPHLSFERWGVTLSTGDEVSGAVDTDEKRRRLRVMIVAGNLYIESYCYRAEGNVVSMEYHKYLNDLAAECGTHLKQSGNIESSLSDFGTTAVAEALKQELQLPKSPITILQFLRGISQQTYENQRISYGVIIVGGRRRAYNSWYY